MTQPIVICLTPVKNEAWILDRFLKCASLWADRIIIADQHSTDGSREIALSYPKVTLMDNPSSQFNEPERQKLLLDAARKIPGQKLLIALDADEILTANFMISPEWTTVINSSPGTVINFRWANLRPDLETYWSPSYKLSLGFMDDNSEHIGRSIHSPRLPIPRNASTISLQDVKVLHYQYTDWERMQSKHRWYQCWERINQPHRRAISIYRQYHHMNAISELEMRSIPSIWIDGYIQQGIDMTSIKRTGVFWWDEQVLDFLEMYGVKQFQHEAIWDINWQRIAESLGRSKSLTSYSDPRNQIDKFIHQWLRKTQSKPSVQRAVVERIISFLGW